MKKLLLLIFFSIPVWLTAQEIKNGAIIFDFNGKNKKATNDTAQRQAPVYEDDTVAEKKREKKKITSRNTPQAAKYYEYKKSGVFSALFQAGVNAAQIDGDKEWGYTYFGAMAGIGAMARFSKLFSLTAELNYSMKGARARLISTPENYNAYEVQWDYVEIPVAANGHFKEWLMASIGLDPGFMVRYKEIASDGLNVTADPHPLGQPRRFDLCGFAGLDFIIKKHYDLGAKFSYSIIKLRGAYSGTHVNGEYNNYITLRFMYILNAIKKKRK